MREKLKFPGIPVYMNGRNYYIPSLSLKQFEENQQVLETGGSKLENESDIQFVVRSRSATVPVIGLAIRRNYPEITDENLVDWLDARSHVLAWQATQNASGMEPVSEGEEQPASE